MKPYIANLINGIILIALGLWGAMESTSPTAYIAPAFGLIFLLSTPMMKKDNKIVAHVVVLLTLLLAIALFMPLMKREGIAFIRSLTMLVSCIVALVVFIKSFIDIRKARG